MLQQRSTKSVYHDIMLQLKLQNHYDYRKNFHISEIQFLISCL